MYHQSPRQYASRVPVPLHVTQRVPSSYTPMGSMNRFTVCVFLKPPFQTLTCGCMCMLIKLRITAQTDNRIIISIKCTWVGKALGCSVP